MRTYILTALKELNVQFVKTLFCTRAKNSKLKRENQLNGAKLISQKLFFKNKKADKDNGPGKRGIGKTLNKWILENKYLND